MNVNGEHIGAIIGFLTTLRQVSDRMKPGEIVIAWEGGGSTRRRHLYPDYKANRRPIRLNRFYDDEIPDTPENQEWQLRTLIGLLRHVHVYQVYAEGCEGDDVIAYLCGGRYRDRRKVIISSDRDLYQLLDSKTIVYAPTRKIYVTCNDIPEIFGVTVQNFALAKAIVGDAGDNIPGVPRVGFKTLAKRVPILSETKPHTIDEVMEHCRSTTSKAKVYNSILESRDLVERNLKLVDLVDNPMLSGHQATVIDGVVDTSTPTFNKIEFMRALQNAGIPDFDTERLWLAIRHMAF